MNISLQNTVFNFPAMCAEYFLFHVTQFLLDVVESPRYLISEQLIV